MQKSYREIFIDVEGKIMDEDCVELSQTMMKAFKSAVVQRKRRIKA